MGNNLIHRNFKSVLATIAAFALAHLLAVESVVAQTNVDANSTARKITRLEGGKVEVAGTIYDSRFDYYQSDTYRSFGSRCGTRHSASSAPRGGDLGDCDAFGTSVLPDYAPSVGRIGIPVVVHVIQHTNGEGNIPTSEIEAQIDILNDAFLARAGTHAAGSANAEIEFFLAETDPDGNPTTGITRTVNNQWFVENGAYWETLAWDTTRYMNVYTLDLDPQGLLGYVEAFPAEEPLVGQTRDRVVVHFGSFGEMGSDGPPYDLGRTLIHEVGHYLGLYHVWGNNFSCSTGAMPGCYSTGDLICDTASQDFERFGCEQTSSCGSDDPISNYMNYSDDICMFEFTPEQVNRMRCTLANYRFDLVTTAPSVLDIEVTPALPVSHSGLSGGPFTNPLTAWSVRKIGTGEVDYNVTIRNNFGLLLNGSTGDVAGTFAAPPDQFRTFQITHSNDLNELPNGTYTAEIVFQNLTAGTEVVREHQLEVGSFSADFAGTPTAIPDRPISPQLPNPGLTTQFLVNQEGTIQDLDINIELLHSWIGDLTVTLTHVDTSTSVIIINRLGSTNCDANNIDVLLDDDGTGGSIQDQCEDNLSSPPSFEPANALQQFNGELIAGVWRLHILDNETFDAGTLITWGLRARIAEEMDDDPDPMHNNPTNNNNQVDTDGDGVFDGFDNCVNRANADQADINVNGIGDACETVVGLAPCPDPITVQASDNTGAVVNFELPAAVGGFGDITVMATPASGTRFPVGTRTVDILAFNNNGSSDGCSFQVTVTAPSAPTPPPMMGGLCGFGMIEMVMIAPAAFLATRRLRRRR